MTTAALGVALPITGWLFAGIRTFHLPGGVALDLPELRLDGRALLFHIQPLDPITLASVAVLILLLSLAVSVKPALRVARVDLSRALREE